MSRREIRIERERKQRKKFYVAHAMRAIPHRVAPEGPEYQCSTCGSTAWTFDAARKHEYRMNVLHGEPIQGSWAMRHLPSRRCIICDELCFGRVCNDCTGRA